MSHTMRSGNCDFYYEGFSSEETVTIVQKSMDSKRPTAKVEVPIKELEEFLAKKYRMELTNRIEQAEDKEILINLWNKP